MEYFFLIRSSSLILFIQLIPIHVPKLSPMTQSHDLVTSKIKITHSSVIINGLLCLLLKDNRQNPRLENFVMYMYLSSVSTKLHHQASETLFLRKHRVRE